MKARELYFASTSMTLNYALLRDAIQKLSWSEIWAVTMSVVSDGDIASTRNRGEPRASA